MLRERKSLYTTFIFVVYAVKVVHNIGRLNISQLLRVLVLQERKKPHRPSIKTQLTVSPHIRRHQATIKY